MTAMEHTALGQALRAVVPCIGTPTLQKVVDALFNPSLAADGSLAGTSGGCLVSEEWRLRAPDVDFYRAHLLAERPTWAGIEQELSQLSQERAASVAEQVR
jgi:hypothetical protein